MINHFIILSSSYTTGKRIALDYIIKDSKDDVIFAIKKIKEKCGYDVSFSTHSIITEKTDWSSVIESDLFFKDVEVIDDLDEFINLINQSRTLSAITVAEYILSKIKCTHLKLEKLVYLCYADYICETSKELFDDDIYAFNYGPVVSSVYNKYKRYKYEEINKYKEANISISSTMQLPIKSRITFTRDGFEKIFSINKTLEKYGDFPANILVNITHSSESPWDIVYDGSMYKKIPKEIIKEYHKNEIF